MSHTNNLTWRPSDQGERKKLKSCAASHAFKPVHGKFPSSNMRWEQKAKSLVQSTLLWLNTGTTSTSVCCMKNHSIACPVWGKGRTLKSKSVRDKRPVLHTATLCSTHYSWCMHSIRWQHLLKCMLHMRHWYNSSCWLHPPCCGHDNIWRKWYTKRFLLLHSNTTSSFAGIPNILFWTVYKKGVASGSVERSRCSGLNKRSF